jgi:predicted RNA-binding protein with PUA-like domain
MSKNYWLLKSEPDTYSWQQMQTDGISPWDGVRNYQARNNMNAMRIGDLCFFYHSNKDREIVGIVEVVREAYPDHTDPSGKFTMVDVKFCRSLAQPVSLAAIKANQKLQEIALIKQSRLSVMPISPTHWEEILRMSGE